MKAILLTTENEKKNIEIKSIRDLKTKICSDFYKSPMEVVHLENNSCLIIDEEGKFKDLDFNELATLIALDNNSISPSDYISGNAVLIEDIDEFDMLPN
jgi:hypothetical protein